MVTYAIDKMNLHFAFSRENMHPHSSVNLEYLITYKDPVRSCCVQISGLE